MHHHEHALSETVAHILIAFLVVVIALLIMASLSGVLTKFLQTPGLLVVTAGPHETSTGGHIIRLHHEQGNAVNLNGTSQTGGKTEIAILLTAQPGSPVLVRNATLMGTSPWRPGQDLYIISPAAGSYRYSDTVLSPGDISPGNYTILIIDARTQVLLHTLAVRIP